MSTDIVISGASDDCVVVGGAIEDEFNTYGNQAEVVVKVDDATHIVVVTEFDRDNDGQWRIELAGSFPHATVSWVRAVGADGPDQQISGHLISARSDVLFVHLGDVDARRIDVSCKETSR